MNILSLQVENFRIISRLSMELLPGWNIIYGNNAQGKSTLLESLYFLAFGKSFKNARDEHLIRFKSSYIKVQGIVSSVHGKYSLELLANKKGKLCKYNDNRVERLNDYIGRLKIVLYSPDEISIIRGNPASRRQFIDALFSQLDGNYLEAWQKYRHAVDEKNRVLKEFRENRDDHLISVYQEEFYERLIQLYTLRLQYVEEFLPMITAQYYALFGDREKISYKYQYKAGSEPFDPCNIRETGRHYLEKEKEHGITLWGPHLDDIVLYLNNKPVRFYASQGQMKSLLLSMKMASIEYIQQKTGHLPVFLIDDFSSELDSERLNTFLKSLPEQMQIIFTATHIPDTVREKGRVFHIEQGSVSVE